MHAEDIGVTRRFRSHEIFVRRDPIGQELFSYQPELLRREDVRAQVQVVTIVID
jgi:hypothetical protein